MKKRRYATDRYTVKSVASLPHFCDFACVHASFSPIDAVGACRKEQAVYCNLLHGFNNKNAPCRARSNA